MTLEAQVEEDPSSQFVDFTNATALEQFVSDIEQALLGWQLANKGHASLEALAAAFPLGGDKSESSNPSSPRSHGPAVWTHVLEFEQAGRPAPEFYALSLFVAKEQESENDQRDDGEQGSDSKGKSGRRAKKWQEGIEHFTPTMLSLVDSSRDFTWREPSHGAGESGMFEEDAVVRYPTVFADVQKWFGIDEFLFLSRATQQQQQSLTQAASRPKAPAKRAKATEVKSPSSATPKDGKSASTSSGATENSAGGDDKDVKEVNGLADGFLDQNEAGLLLSALTIALNNCNCTVPAFVPVLEPSRGTWIGTAVPGATGNVSIVFETDSVPELNPNQSCISGLLDFFKLKLQLPPQVEEKCRLAVEDTGEIGIGMDVSASFGYTWSRTDDPRETSAPEGYPSSWNEFTGQVATKHPSHVQRIASGVFGGKLHPPLGPTSSPVTALSLKVGWPNLREGTYVDNVVHSTLDPVTAPDWTLKVHFQNLVTENARKPQLPLSKLIANLVQAYSNSKELNKDILVSELAPNINDYPPGSSTAPSAAVPTPPPSVDKASSNEGHSYTTPSRYSDSIPASRAAAVIGNAIGSLISATTWKAADVEEVRRVVAGLFDEDEAQQTPNGPLSLPSAAQHGVPVGQLVSILACRMGQLHGINSMALLWVEFVKGLRDRWFQQKLLPFMSTAPEEGTTHTASSTSLNALFLLDADTFQLPHPDFHQCLLHQKLQLLNCCILREAELARSREHAESTNAPHSTMSELTAFTLDDGDGGDGEGEDGGEGQNECEGEGSPSDDEFFDTVEQRELHSSPTHEAVVASEGGIRSIPGVVCLRTNAPLIEPATQYAVPMTEDVARQQQDLLTRLGVSLESAMLRQQIQSTVLISDMQAFKAANPESCLADFIRWYSPKDWIAFDPLQAEVMAASLPEDGKDVWWFERKGMLSDRMRFGPSQEHIWQHMWETSAPVPASRQKRLFDPVQEAEKLFHYLETMQPHEMLHQVLAGAISSVLFALENALPVAVDRLPAVKDALVQLQHQGDRAIMMLDEALTESLVPFPVTQKEEHERAKSQLQVAFEMALDACWKLVRGVECVEALVSNALGVMQYLLPPDEPHSAEQFELVNLLLLQSLPVGLCKEEIESAHELDAQISARLQDEALRRRVGMLVLENPTLAGPVEREYVLRCVCPRPFLREYFEKVDFAEEEGEETSSMFDATSVTGGDGRFASATAETVVEESPLVVSRMYAAFRKNTVRFALALAEAEF